MLSGWNSANISRSIKATWGLKNRFQVVAVGLVLLVGVIVFLSLGSRSKPILRLSRECQIPAIYNFGDSNSDTGCVSAAFHRVPHPNGISFFGKPSGRYCDGRLIIDFIAKKLGLPYLSAYLDALEANFQHGADFAASGTTIQHVDGKLYGSGLNPLSLDVQLVQFEELKERTSELRSQDNVNSRFPRLEDFSKALYTFDIGQNDIHHALAHGTEDEARSSIPELINQLALAIKNFRWNLNPHLCANVARNGRNPSMGAAKWGAQYDFKWSDHSQKLHQLGARSFWIHNTGPIGCLPYVVLKYPPKPENTDEGGCVKSFNEVAQEFNRQLKNRISELRTELQESLLVYVDIYTAKFSLISNSKKHGFIDPLGYCCKHAGNSKLHCWRKKVNGTGAVYATPCNNPSEYISWDSIHYTEAANQWVANRISDGSLSDPPLPFTKLCTKSFL